MEKKRYHWRITLPGWTVVWVALSIFGASFVHRVNLLLLVFALMISAVIVSSRLGRRQIRQLAATRSFPLLVTAGRPFSTIVDVINLDAKRRAFGIDVAEAPITGQTPSPAEASLFDIPAGQTKRILLTRTINRRGTYPLGPIRLTSGFPLGMVRWRFDIPQKDQAQVLVHPPIGQLQYLGRQRLGIKGAGEGKPNVSLLEGTDEFRGVRDYRPGDPARLVHWRSTAKRGSLVVRELDPTAGRGILLVTLLVPSARGTEHTMTETLLSFVSTVVVDISKDPTLALTLLIVGKEPALIRGNISSTRLSSYLRALALAEPTTDPADLEQARRLLRETDTRDRRYWLASLDGVAPEGRPVWGPLPTRRTLQPIVLNASAGDLESLWIPPSLSVAPSSGPSDLQTVQNSTSTAG